jgi:hypothetical protein
VIPKELVLLRKVLQKEKHHGEWFNYVIENVNCLAFYDMAVTLFMTTVYDPTEDEYVYFDAIKRPSIKDKALPRPSTNRQGLWVLRKLYAIDQYNKQMGGADSHAQ